MGPLVLADRWDCPASRAKRTRLPQYADGAESDVFLLSGAEDLVPVLGVDGQRQLDETSAPGFSVQQYRPRIEGSFARIERWTNRETGEIHWPSISRDNVTTLYGLQRARDARGVSACPKRGAALHALGDPPTPLGYFDRSSLHLECAPGGVNAQGPFARVQPITI